jgi:hypothetical protein
MPCMDAAAHGRARCQVTAILLEFPRRRVDQYRGQRINDVFSYEVEDAAGRVRMAQVVVRVSGECPCTSSYCSDSD